MTKIKKVFKRLGEISLIILITLFLSEIVFRIYNKFYPSFIFYETIYNRYRGKPFGPDYDNFYLNSQGFKDVEFPETKSPETFRIIALGDSFAFGVIPYQHNYLTLLEEGMQNQGKNIEVLNMGIPGLGPRDYLSLVVNEGLALEPDMVLLSFFIGNDFLENQMLKDKYGVPAYNYSYIISFLKFLINLQQNYEGKIFHPNPTYIDDSPTFNDEYYLKLSQERAWIYTPANEFFYDSLKDVMSYLKQIQEICNRQNINLTIVIIPDEIQVNPDLQTRVIAKFNADAKFFNFEQPNLFLINELKANNIDYIDLLEPFQDSARQVNLYKPNDSHWNIAGNRLAAEKIQKYLRIDK